MLELSQRDARRLAIGAQRLAGPTPKRPTKALMRDTIRHLGALQIDSISVVARSHHIVLWSRLGVHPHEWLYELHGVDRALFEYWAHAAAYVPIEYFPYFRRRMLNYADPNGNGYSARWKQWARENQHVFEQVLSHIRTHGPVSSSTFDAPEGEPKATPWAWYGNKPTNRALDFLWTNGTLMIDRRDKFQRWYDLRERVHPTWDDADLPTVEEERRFLGEKALAAMGVTTVRWFNDYFRGDWGSRGGSGSISRLVMQQLVDEGTAVPARVEGLDEPAFVHAPLLSRRIPPSRTTLLSPFDNLVWDRRRTLGLFGFSLMLEVYTPAEKRQFGYFSLPILYRDKLVGRIDPKADRKARVLILKVLHLEEAFESHADDRFFLSLARTIDSFREFNACDGVVVERGEPETAARALRATLEELGGVAERG